MKRLVLLALFSSVALPSVFAQNLAPATFKLAWGCNEIAQSYSTYAVGVTSCDNPAATQFYGTDYFEWSGDVGSYYIGCGLRNGDGTYSPFGEPILPYSCAASWIVGGYNYIYNNGAFFDGSGGVQTWWYDVVANQRGDAFVLGVTNASPL